MNSKQETMLFLFLGNKQWTGLNSLLLIIGLSAWRSIGPPQDNLGAGLLLPLSGLFTASEVVQGPEFISACLVLSAKQVPGVGSIRRVKHYGRKPYSFWLWWCWQLLWRIIAKWYYINFNFNCIYTCTIGTHMNSSNTCKFTCHLFM